MARYTISKTINLAREELKKWNKEQENSILPLFNSLTISLNGRYEIDRLFYCVQTFFEQIIKDLEDLTKIRSYEKLPTTRRWTSLSNTVFFCFDAFIHASYFLVEKSFYERNNISSIFYNFVNKECAGGYCLKGRVKAIRNRIAHFDDNDSMINTGSYGMLEMTGSYISINSPLVDLAQSREVADFWKKKVSNHKDFLQKLLANHIVAPRFDLIETSLSLSSDLLAVVSEIVLELSKSARYPKTLK